MLANANFKCGYIHGTGAAENVELGFIPDWVEIYNLTDGDKIHVGPVRTKVMAFTSGGLATAVGGSSDIKAGDTIKGLTTTSASAVIEQIILDSGSFAGGDAAGWLVLDFEDVSGTFTAENAEVNDSGGNDITLSAAADNDGLDIDTEVAATTTAATTVTPYTGSSTPGSEAAKGFTIGATVSENAKLLYYKAYRGNHAVDQVSTVW